MKPPRRMFVGVKPRLLTPSWMLTTPYPLAGSPVGLSLPCGCPYYVPQLQVSMPSGEIARAWPVLPPGLVPEPADLAERGTIFQGLAFSIPEKTLGLLPAHPLNLKEGQCGVRERTWHSS